MRSENKSKSKSKSKSETDWKRISDMRNGAEEIDTTDIAEIDESMWANAEFGRKKTKTAISLRIDTELLEFLKDENPNYQTKMNEIIRNYVEWRKKTSDDK